MVQLLHTPEGVRDYYNEECAQKLTLCQKVRSMFQLYGYQEIQTPVFEYFDIFNAERGSVASRDMYKLFDRDGETLVLRPDYTPAIARCASKYFAAETLPVRLSYVGNTYVNNNSLRGQMKETMQAGVELVGDSTVEANAEILALIVDVLKNAGLDRFQIEVGDVRYFQGLLEESGITSEIAQELRTCIENKNHFGLEELLDKYGIADSVREALVRLPQMFGNPEQILAEARTLTSSTKSLEALDRLEELRKCMEAYGMDKYLTFDLGMLGTHDYYTGIIFKGYTYGTGDCIVFGGRYDKLMEQFGKEAASVGFGINLDVLMQAMKRQKIELPGRPESILLLYAPERFADAVSLAGDYRRQSISVHMVQETDGNLDRYAEYAKENKVIRILKINSDGKIQEYIPASRFDKILPCPESGR
ncbi:MAG: ATP phosphoribosyltransferase regulatory subunit [Clostridiales bacterium]|nr:ATP phosphoribosyltransferase regulatory subunit [Clostridiales bacterium]